MDRVSFTRTWLVGCQQRQAWTCNRTLLFGYIPDDQHAVTLEHAFVASALCGDGQLSR